MTKYTIITAIAQNNVIGNNGKLPWFLPEDLKFFKEITMGKTLLMGKNTFLSINSSLPGRKILVFSKTLQDPKMKDIKVIRNTHELFEEIKDLDELFICGGKELYKTFYPIANRVIITHINKEYEGDVKFPVTMERIFWDFDCAKQLKWTEEFSIMEYTDFKDTLDKNETQSQI